MYVREERSRREAEYQAYAVNISSANFALSTLASCPIRSQCAGVTSLRSVRNRLDALPERLRHWEWGFFALAADPSLRTVRVDSEVEEFFRTVDGRRLLLNESYDRRTDAIDAINPARAASLYPGWVLAVGQGGTALVLTGRGSPGSGAQVWAPQTLQFVDVASGRVLQSLPIDSKSTPRCAAISADNRRAVMAIEGGQFIVWDVVAGAQVVSSRPGAVIFASKPEGFGWDERKEICSLGLSRDGSLVLSSLGGVAAWSALTGTTVATDPASLPVLNEPVSEYYLAPPPIAFSPDGRRAAIGRLDGEVALLDLTSRPITVQFLPARGVVVQALAFSTNGARLVVSTSPLRDFANTNRVSLWALERAPHRVSEFNHDSSVSALAFSADDATILGHCDDGDIHMWAATSMAAITTPPDSVAMPSSSFSTAVSFSGRLVASISAADASVAIWRVSDAARIATWATTRMDSLDPGVTDDELKIRSLSFSADERSLVIGYPNGHVEIRRVPSGTLVRDFAAHREGAPFMATSRDGRWLATGASEGQGQVRVWDWVTGVEQSMFESPEDGDGITSLAFRSDAVLVIATWRPWGGGTAYLWDWRSKRILASVHVGEFLLDIAISPEDGRIAFANAPNGRDDLVVSIWDSAMTHEIARLMGTEATSVAYSPDGQRLVTAGGRTRIWNAERFDLLAALDLGATWRVRFTPDGRRLVVAGEASITILDSRGPARPPVRRLVLNDRRTR